MIGKLTPKRLFLIDGIGALLSAFMLGIVLVRYESFFGIPTGTLQNLAKLALGLVVYDITSYTGKARNSIYFLQFLPFANLTYCALSIAYIWPHHEKITTSGWIYIIGEFIIVLLLAQFEWRFAKRLKVKE